MTPKTKRRRRVDKPNVGKDAYVVLSADGETLTDAQPAAVLALVRAQDQLQRLPATTTATYRVVRQSLFGPDVLLYRVVRDEDGTVSTFTINPED